MTPVTAPAPRIWKSRRIHRRPNLSAKADGKHNLGVSRSVSPASLLLGCQRFGLARGGVGAGRRLPQSCHGVFFAFFTIVLGAVAIGASNKIPGILLIIFSILGAFLGGTLVAIWMAIALVGGILAIVGVGQERKDLTATTDN